MKIIIICVIAIAILVIGICLSIRLNNKNKKLDEETRKFNNDKVVDELVNENSELYKFVKDYVHLYVNISLFYGGSDYNYFKANMVESLIYALDEELKKNGTEIYQLYLHNYSWLNTESELVTTKESLATLIESIMNMPEIDAEISKHFVEAISSNIAEANEHENNAIENNKKYDKAPGNDEELHPRIPMPEDHMEEEINEISIDALSTTGTVEDIN